MRLPVLEIIERSVNTGFSDGADIAIPGMSDRIPPAQLIGSVPVIYSIVVFTSEKRYECMLSRADPDAGFYEEVSYPGQNIGETGRLACNGFQGTVFQPEGRITARCKNRHTVGTETEAPTKVFEADSELLNRA